MSLLRRSYVLPWPGTLPGAAHPTTLGSTIHRRLFASARCDADSYGDALAFRSNRGIWARGLSRYSWGRSGATSQAEEVPGWRGMGGGDFRRPQGHEPTKHFEGVSSAPSATRLYRRAHHPPPMWGPDWLAILRVRILRQCKECGAPRNTMECMEMLELSKSWGPLNMFTSCVILGKCAESV